jgi:hypothetical protein
MASGEIEVTPGRVLTEDELINYAKLNDLGQPTLRIKEQTVTSRELADGSISADKLDQNLEAQLALADGAVSTAKIADGAVTAPKLATGTLRNSVSATYTARTLFTSSVIPGDDTKPQSSEGKELLTVTIQPHFVTSKVRLTVNGVYWASTNCYVCFAYFRDGAGSNCLSARLFYHGQASPSGGHDFHFLFEDSPAAITPLVYRVRAGALAGPCDLYFNTYDANYLGANTNIVTFIAEEIYA